MKARKIILAGGTGFIGQSLIRYWKDTDIDLVILSRNSHAATDRVRYVRWDGETLGAWIQEIDGADVLVNLAGKSVDCRYTKRNKRLIISSRIKSTRILGEAIRRTENPPQLWINSASATIYRHTFDQQMDELTGEIDDDFSVQVCKAWEQTFWTANVPDTVRKVVLRMAIVIGNGGGALPVLKRLVRFGLGGKMGNGNQFVSWIHERDLGRMIDFIIETDSISGTYNGSAPTPVSNRNFMASLRHVLGVPVGLPAPRWLLEIGSLILRTETELVLKSRNVVPRKLVEAGFQFEFSQVRDAITDLVSSQSFR